MLRNTSRILLAALIVATLCAAFDVYLDEHDAPYWIGYAASRGHALCTVTAAALIAFHVAGSERSWTSGLRVAALPLVGLASWLVTAAVTMLVGGALAALCP